MAYTNPSVADFKAYFTRDFTYSADPSTGVTDADITKAFGQTGFLINQGLFSSQDQYNIGYLLLSAHFLVVDLRMSSQSTQGRFSWAPQSKSVGSVSESFAIPQRILDNPNFSGYGETNYGAKYLLLILPQICGQVFAICGTTLP